MIVHKVNDPPSAQRFQQRAKNYVIFAKFYSPTCPACIASEEEWGLLKDNLAPENRDKFDLAEVDPEGMRCLLYTSPSPRDRQKCRMPSSA